MKRFFLTCLLVLMCSVCAAFSNEPTGFRDVSFGDDYATVEKYFGPLQVMQKGDNSIMAGGKLRNNFSLAGNPLRPEVVFSFYKGGLALVALTFDLNGQNPMFMEQCIMEAMTQRFGKYTLNQTVYDKDKTARDEYAWKSDKALVCLSVGLVYDNYYGKMVNSDKINLALGDARVVQYHVKKERAADQGW